MRKIAVLSPAPTSPTDFGNRKRIERISRNLKDRGFAIHFIFYALEDPWRKTMPGVDYAKMKEDWDDFHLVIPTGEYHSGAKGEDHELDEWWDIGLERFLWWYLRSQQFDAILVNYIYLSRALYLVPEGVVRILDTHDRFSGRREILSNLGISPEFFHLTREEEARGLSRADLAIAIKDEEKAYFESLSDASCMSLPYAEQPIPRRPVPPDPDGYLRIGLLGGRNSINRHSVERFLEYALPVFFKQAAPVRIVLAGTMCRDLEKYRHHRLIDFLGPVDDVGEFYDAIDLVAAPIEHSTGQKIKVAEAIAYGSPIIATAHAFEGFTPTSPMHRCRSLAEIVEYCIRVSYDPSKLGMLTYRSAESAEQQERLFQARMDQMVHIIEQAPRAVVVIDGEALQGSQIMPPRAAQALETLDPLAAVSLLMLESDPVSCADDGPRFRGLFDRFDCISAISVADAADRIASASVVWSIGSSLSIDDLPEDWSGMFVSDPYGTTCNADQKQALQGPTASIIVKEIGPGRETYLASTYSYPGVDLNRRVARGVEWRGAGRAAMAALPTTLPGKMRELIINALLDLHSIDTVVIIAETDAQLDAIRAQRSGDAKRLRFFNPSAAYADWPTNIEIGLDLSFGDQAFAACIGVLEQNANAYFAARKALVQDGWQTFHGTSAMELLDWITAAGRGQAASTQTTLSGAKESASLLGLLRNALSHQISLEATTS